MFRTTSVLCLRLFFFKLMDFNPLMFIRCCIKLFLWLCTRRYWSMGTHHKHEVQALQKDAGMTHYYFHLIFEPRIL